MWKYFRRKKAAANCYVIVFFILHCRFNKLTHSCRRSLSYRNQSIDLQKKSLHWFLYDRYLCHERHLRCGSGVFIGNFEHISNIFLVFLLLTLNNQMLAGKLLEDLPLGCVPLYIFVSYYHSISTCVIEIDWLRVSD